ncbi:DUF6701 domain-containing protein [Vibrio coralliirubri]|uniref:DUF6701 domain-containing protein n=1 Tax=Vibrio coralliirubri TaxID=1516159 RepID=UPI002FD1BAEB
MIKHFSILLVALFLSPLVQANINTNPQFEFGTIPADKCTISGASVSCELDFGNTYTSPPLVFVMATVNSSRSNFNSNTTEYPSDLRVMSVSTSGASVKQLLPPTTKACVRMKPGGKCGNPNDSGHKAVTYVDAPMENIDYLVIEPGVLEFDNGAKIVAGEVSYDKTYSNAGGGLENSHKTVRFSDFGLNQSFSSSPGVLVQIQTVQNSINGSPLWLTPIALNPYRSSFSLVLDRSEVSRNSYSITPEKVGFVAGLGQGFVNGRKFWLGQGSTKQTSTLNDDIIKPITEGCKLVSLFSVSGFTSTPTLLASKRTRKGNNGGWLRRCSVSKTGVSLINEEDMTRDPERGHVVEPFSYFLFDKPPLSEICELFPSPAQTWTSNNQASITIENNANISGAPISGGKRYIGFAQSDVTDRKSKGCDGTECFGDTGLRVTKQQLESFQAPDSGLETVTVQNNQTRIFQNNESIGTLTINNNATLVFKTGTYWIDSIYAIGDIEIPPGNAVEIHTKGFALSNGSNFSALDNGELTVYVHDLSYNGDVIHSWVDLASNSKFVGLLYSEKNVILSSNAVVEGAVTAKSITLNNGSEIIATNKCFEPADDYEIDISPATDLALMCGDDSPQFTINTSNNSVVESLGVTIDITPTPEEFDVSVSKGTGAYPNYVSNEDGELTLKVVAKDTANIDFDTGYKLTATLVDDSGKEVESQFKFVPFKFSLVDGSTPTNRLDVIAGQATPTVTKVLACDSGDSIVVAENYIGEAGDEVTIAHELDSSWSGSGGSLTYLPEFKKGSASTDLTISESGLFNVTLKDNSFDCTGFAGCPEDGSYDVEGSFSVYSRPWKLAICTSKSSDGNSNEKDSDSFSSAGESFDVYARPIKHTNSSAVCTNDNLLTNNYFKSTASVEVTTTLDTPLITVYLDAKLGDLTPVAQLTKQISSNDQANKGYKFESLKYSEAGSFNFIATETGSFYGSILGGFSGSKSIGRFYPKFFVQGTPEWNVANQNDIAYLSQPYDSTVHQVYPMASGESGVGNALNNYRFFHSDLQAEFGVLDDTAIDNRFLLDTGAGTWSTDRKHWLLNDSAAVLERVTDSDSVSRKDNPFNTSDANSTVTHFGLTVDGADPVSFTDSDPVTDSAAFPVQPPARYGRMALDDIGGNSGTTLTVPLRAEFWDGSEFVVNEDDDRSTFNSSNTCKQVIWHSEGVTTTLASLSGSGSVDDGEEDVTANQNTPAGTDAPREQVRLWLRMDASEPDSDGGNNISCSGGDQDQPWLRYNWRQLGDEDPSTVVTFGIYRGNDRVFYRGESGLTGQ